MSAAKLLKKLRTVSDEEAVVIFEHHRPFLFEVMMGGHGAKTSDRVRSIEVDNYLDGSIPLPSSVILPVVGFSPSDAT